VSGYLAPEAKDYGVNARKSVAMVDVASPTTMRLARGLVAAGYDVVRVQSTAEIPHTYLKTFDGKAFSDNIVHYGNYAATLEAVAKHEPIALLTGGETGVELADRLSESLGLATNGTAHSAARRDKYEQGRLLHTSGVPAARHMLVTDEEELASWHREFGSGVVIKPVGSAGNDGVSFCDSVVESVAAYRAVRDMTTIFDTRNEGVVAQEYLFGTEYAVDTASCAGRHRVTDVWEYEKVSVNGVVDRTSALVLIPAENQVRAVLSDYAFAVLDALGVRYGPAHLEIICTPSGPRLVEAGIRLAGADLAYYAHLAAGESQIEWTIDAFVDPDRFLANYRSPYRLTNHVSIAFPTSPVEGMLNSYPGLIEARKLPSYHNEVLFFAPGDYLPKTIDNESEPLIIGLAHPAADVVKRDLLSIYYLDGPGFYDVTPAAA
jgi:biotin carboxylase